MSHSLRVKVSLRLFPEVDAVNHVSSAELFDYNVYEKRSVTGFKGAGAVLQAFRRGALVAVTEIFGRVFLKKIPQDEFGLSIANFVKINVFGFNNQFNITVEILGEFLRIAGFQRRLSPVKHVTLGLDGIPSAQNQ
jgi:hypothetical protein